MVSREARARTIRGVTVWLACALLVGVQARSQVQGAAPAGIVVAELFTSEGCSSCPPADAVLSALAAGQPIEGVEILALGEHVDYWDRQGWRDQFSSAAFSERQGLYDERVFHAGQVYTPQFIADGQFQCVGSDREAVWRAVRAAAALPKATVRVNAGPPADGRIEVGVRVDVPSTIARNGAADLLVALTEDRLQTRVRGGENASRTLTHDAVVRSLSVAGTLAPGVAHVEGTAHLSVAKAVNPSALRVVAFLQERQSRRILGGGACAVHPR
jgi:hypothetical protein